MLRHNLLIAVPGAYLVEGRFSYLQLRRTQLPWQAQPCPRTEHHRHSGLPGASQRGCMHDLIEPPAPK